MDSSSSIEHRFLSPMQPNMKTRLIRITAILVSSAALCAADPKRAATDGTPGVTGVTQSPVRLHMPHGATQGDAIRYGLAFPLQVGPKTAAVLVNRHIEGKGVGDFEDGTDLIVFDSLPTISASVPVPLSRKEIVNDPSMGEPRVFVAFPELGGFVPVGARRADGTPHPHAGTGFCLGYSHGYFMKENGAPRPPDAKNPASQPLSRTLFHQLAFDGKKFSVVDQSPPPGKFLWTDDSKWRVVSAGLNMAIPDGDDLLLAVKASGKGHHCGVARWVHRSEGWRCASFAPVPDAEGLMEPTLARDADGTLLFTARVGDRTVDEAYALRVWRSGDAGQSWKKIVNVPSTLDAGPRGIGTAADGSPFVIGNPVQPNRSYFREVIQLWPLNAARDGIEQPIMVRDAPTEFGPSPKNAKWPSDWKLDHGNTAVVRLADGLWHCLLGYRVMRNDILRPDAPEIVHKVSGAYIEEIKSRGPARPTWNFAE
jgi:hypothetical protein